MTKAVETKYLGGRVLEVKEESRNGEPVGIVEGYIATWDIDRGGYSFRDQFVKGCFAESIREYRRDKRQIRFKDHHGRTIGGFPIDSVKEDSRGLFGRGEINLNVQQGREAYALAKQGVLVDFSIGFQVDEGGASTGNGLRKITKAIIWEGSIVDEPMNPKANVTDVKQIEGDTMHDDKDQKTFLGFPLVDDDAWNSVEAMKRIAEFTDDGTKELSGKYKSCFLGFDPATDDNCKTVFADVKNGEIVAVYEGVKTAMVNAPLIGFTGEKNIRDAIEQFKNSLDASTFAPPYMMVEEVKTLDRRGLEAALQKGTKFSRSAAKLIAGLFGEDEPASPTEDLKGWKSVSSEITAFLSDISKSE